MIFGSVATAPTLPFPFSAALARDASFPSAPFEATKDGTYVDQLGFCEPGLLVAYVKLKDTYLMLLHHINPSLARN
jgi:hypothetical protein